jgi:hypothetical protein
MAGVAVPVSPSQDDNLERAAPKDLGAAVWTESPDVW